MIIYDNLVMHIMAWSVHAFCHFSLVFFPFIIQMAIGQQVFVFGNLLAFGRRPKPNDRCDNTDSVGFMIWAPFIETASKTSPFDAFSKCDIWSIEFFLWDFHLFKFSFIDWLIDWRSMDDAAISWKRVYSTIAIISRFALWNWQWTIATSGCYWHDRT